jgi:glycosyltransferase involved in cell wall biosynthesis
VHVEPRYIPEAQITRFFGQSSVTVLPYTHASQTGVGSTAIGFGVPTIVSDIGGLPDLTLDKSYVFQAGDETALANAILSHIDDGIEIRRRVLEQVAAPRSWDSVGARTLELYEGLRRTR